MQKRITIFICIFCFIQYSIFAQKKNVLDLNAPPAALQNIACKQVILDPGFSYTAVPNSTFVAGIDPYQVCDVDYVGIGANGSIPSDPFSTSNEVGSIQGNFAVSATGSATYSVKLFCPPGTGGMEPHLSIGYNSSSGDGLMGKGFYLTGLSRIEAVSNNIYFDGFTGGINLQDNPRSYKLMLDGMRLVPVSGSYWSGSMYRTETEDFRRIEDTGNSFKVHEKDGTVMEYGVTADAKVGGYKWLLNKIIDPRGNYMNIHYYNVDGESRPDYIEYTGNSGAGLSPYNQVKFVYSKRDDAQRAYISGTVINQTVLLSGIEYFVSGQKVHEYRLNYSYDRGSQLSEIMEITQQGKQYNSTKFTYNAAEPQYGRNLSITQVTSDGGSFTNLDYNGDGYADLVKVKSGQMYLYKNEHISTGTNFSLASTMALPPAEGYFAFSRSTATRVVDFNGDGLEDFMFIGTSTSASGSNFLFNNGFYFYKAKSDGSSVELFKQQVFAGLNKPLLYTLGDFNGDGATDFFYYDRSTSTASIYDVKNDQSYSFSIPLAFDENISTWDKDGDGKDEILVTTFNYATPVYTKGNYIVLEFKGGQLLRQDGNKVLSNVNNKGDFNGDGKVDILHYDADNHVWEVLYSKGDGTFDVASQCMIDGVLQSVLPYEGDPENTSTPVEYLVADFNGDGKADILKKTIGNNATTFTALFSEGNSLFHSKIDNVTGDASTRGNLLAVGDFVGNSTAQMLSANNTNVILEGYPGNQAALHKVVQITNGLNHHISINYSNISQLQFDRIDPELGSVPPSYHSADVAPTFPLREIPKSVSLVVSAKMDNGIGSNYSRSDYSYTGGTYHLQGKGFLGFTKTQSTESTTQTAVTSEYEISGTHNFTMLPTHTTVQRGGTAISDKLTPSYFFQDLGNKSFFLYPSQTVNTDQLTGVTSTYTCVYDNFGNCVSEQNQNAAETTQTVNTYTQTSGAMPSSLASAITTTTRTGQPAYSRKVDISYNTSTGTVKTEVRDGDKAQNIVTNFYYNSLNLPTQTDIIGSDAGSFTLKYEYEPNGRFITKETNTLNQYIQATYDPVFGNPITKTDINGLVTSYLYDGFGRLTQTILPTGHKTTVTRGWEDGSIPNAVYFMRSTEDGKGPVTEHYDLMGRIIQDETTSFSGNKIRTSNTFNNKGEMISSTLAHLDGSTTPSHQTSFTYLADGRLSQKNTLSGELILYEYSPASTTVTVKRTINGQVKASSKTYDASGKLSSLTDEMGNSVSYQYRSCGQPFKITTPTSEINSTYDDYGRQIELRDPDAGISTYSYNAFGELLSETTPRQKTCNLTYDGLRRVTQKQWSDGKNVIYRYDATPATLGLLSSVTYNNITTTYSYDNFERVQSQKENIDGTDYITQYGYDAHNRVTHISYPSGFAVNKQYNSSGYLEKITRETDGSLIWQCTDVNALNRITSFATGNTVTTKTYSDLGYLQSQVTSNGASQLQNLTFAFDEQRGNLLSRASGSNLTESFQPYDELDRLTSITQTINGNVQPVQSITYDAGGSIMHLPGTGDYKYEAGQPHAVTKIINPGPALPSVQQDVTYNTFNKAETITEGGNSLSITYGPFQERKKQVFTNGSLTQTKYYSGSYEKVINGSITRELSYISGADGLCAVHVKNGNLDTIYYVNTDHLGSVVLVTNNKDNSSQQYSYDAWGRERNPADWSYTLPTTRKLYFDRGYTGQEHLRAFNLVNMNGRMYDPLTGRMLSPDNNITNSENTQNYNRFSYALNNPLKYTDPTGNDPDLDWYVNDNDPNVIMWRSGSAYALNFNGEGYSNIGATFSYAFGGDIYSYNQNQLVGIQSYYPADFGTASSFQLDASKYLTKASDFKLNLPEDYLKTNLPEADSHEYAKEAEKESPLLENAGIAGYVSHGFLGTAAELSAHTKFRYAERIGKTVKSAIELTEENEILFESVALKLNAAGGLLGAGVSGIKAIHSYSEGNTGMAIFHGSKAASYIIGTALLFVPGAQGLAGYILLSTLAVDITGDAVEAFNKQLE